MKKIEFVYNYINNIKLEEIKKGLLEGTQIGVDASQIEENLGIVRNNASTLLNGLCKQGKLIKIKGRPVRFVSRNILDKLLNNSLVKNEYSVEEIKHNLSELNFLNGQKESDPFKTLIGYNLSLRTQVDQAKAAIVYPPNGLHTLILGPSGVGKTIFAKIMYEYAKIKRKKYNEKFPFVSQNCSDYYNNPQLLLAQLFGHVKGAYTGAVTDKEGLVEKANGGILFLDEVHRLPPDGQEILFYLMDKGEYHRLGETDNTRKSEVLIIAATTEDPQEVLLRTFLRRIPVIITLPSLKEKSIGERLEIIESLLVDEAIRINNKLNVSPEVLKALCMYECKGNIGQLKSDIKLICAKAFLVYLQKKDELIIEFDMLSQNIKNSIFNINKLDIETQEYLNAFKEDLIIYPSEKHKKATASEEDIYAKIADKLEKMKEEGLSDQEIYIEISKVIDNYYRHLIKKFHYKNFNIRELYRVIDKEIVDFTFGLVTLASEELEKEFDPSIMFGLAFHLSALLKRIKLKEPIVNQELLKIKELYREEYEVASLIVKKISEKFKVSIPMDENGFIAVLLANNKKENITQDKIGIIVIAHGISTATSIANVCNKLLSSDFVKAIDMPLEKSVEETYHKVLSLAKTLDRGKGILLLVDMGSLKTFGDKITEETGIITRTVDKVSTPVVLEVVRKVMYKKCSIDEIYNSFIGDGRQFIDKDKAKQNAIITVCSTGKGTSLMMQKVLSSLLEKVERNNIKIIPFDYSTVDKNASEYKNALKNYKIIASVGNINPNIGVPYFSIDDILNKSLRKKFIKFLDSRVYEYEKIDEKSCYEVSREMLEEFVMFINPKMVITYTKKFINALDIDDISDLLITSLAIHIGYMLERIITNNKVVFEGLNEYIDENLKEFNILKKAIKMIEEPFKVQVSDDELCYILKIIKKS